jgi:hypothetical protein
MISLMFHRATKKKDPDLVEAGSFGNELEANLAKSTLEAAGIDCMLTRDDCGGMEPPLSMVQGIKLLVRAADSERAAAVLRGETEVSDDPNFRKE